MLAEFSGNITQFYVTCHCRFQHLYTTIVLWMIHLQSVITLRLFNFWIYVISVTHLLSMIDGLCTVETYSTTAGFNCQGETYFSSTSPEVFCWSVVTFQALFPGQGTKLYPDDPVELGLVLQRKYEVVRLFFFIVKISNGHCTYLCSFATWFGKVNVTLISCTYVCKIFNKDSFRPCHQTELSMGPILGPYGIAYNRAMYEHRCFPKKRLKYSYNAFQMTSQKSI